MESVKLIEKGLEEVSIEILSLLAELNTKCFEFQHELVYKYEFVDNEIVNIKVLSIELDLHYGAFDGSTLEYLLFLNLSNGKRKRLYEIGLSRTLLLYSILQELRCAAFSKDKGDVFSKKLHVEGKDIIITDPCYIIKERKRTVEHKYINYRDYDLIKKNNWKISELSAKQVLAAYKKYQQGSKLQKKYDEEYYSQGGDDWEDCDYGDNMEALGISNYLVTSTLYGDWSCTTFKEDTNEAIGHFCADAGLVGVFILDEVLEYNPKFDYHLNREWTTTLIKNFTGDIWFEKHHHEGVYEDTTEWHKKGDTWEEDTIHVVGKGNVNFITKQTGL
jgi:hypothetical protein